MSIFDVVLLIILGGFAFYGLFFGLIRTVGSLAGLLVGIWLAKLAYIPAFELIKNLFFGYDAVGRIVIFLILFTIINRLVCLGFVMLDRAYNILSIIPFLKTINRLAGALFGFILGSLILGLIFYVIALYPFLYKILERFMGNSQVVPFLVKFTAPMIILLPSLWGKTRGWFLSA